jgi:VWFA-related protein
MLRAALLAIGFTSIVAAWPGAQAPVFRGTADIVPVFVTVTDREGRLVSNLARADFQLFDNGIEQPLALFDSTPQPISLIALLDTSGSMAENLPVLREACVDLASRLSESDVARVGTFGKRITFTPNFTRDPAQLTAVLPKAIAANEPTPLWRAVDEALTEVGKATSGRKVILVLSDGKDSGPEIGQKLVTPANIRDRAEKEDVMVYGVGLRSAPGPVAPGGVRSLADVLRPAAPDPTLGNLAIGTGGGYVELKSADTMREAFAKIADELHRQYLLGFAPASRDGKVHTIEIRVRAADLRPQARKTYVAPR